VKARRAARKAMKKQQRHQSLGQKRAEDAYTVRYLREELAAAEEAARRAQRHRELVRKQ
jgi:hypothetical protein